MKFAKWVFRIAGIYGVAVITPLWFTESSPQIVPLPPLTHPEFYYGFTAVTLAWQVAFLVISLDPVRYRLLMIPAILEKFLFVGALVMLHLQGRFPQQFLLGGTLDLVLGILFVIAFVRTSKN